MENSSMDEHQFKMEDKLSSIQRMLQAGDFDVAVKESCVVFEVVFKRIFQQAIISLSFKDREAIFEKEKEIGKGHKGVQDFTFGELVGLYRESRLLEKWSKHTSMDLGIVQALNFSEIVTLRNKLTHQGASCSLREATLVFEYLRNLLAVLGLADLEGSIQHSFKEAGMPAAAGDHSEQSGGLLGKLPAIKRTTAGKSLYSSSYGSEKERLRTQSNNTKAFDMRVLRPLLEAKPDNLIGLDLGCADGSLTVDRFGGFSAVGHIVGIDSNAVKIGQANETYEGDRFSFHQLDIEDDQFDRQIQEILAARQVDGFDFIFSALTIHHLSNPRKALIKLRKLLKSGGFLLLRGSDDGSKLAYPDDQNLVKSILFMTMEIEGVSDRENGRKLAHQLKKSGFNEIDMHYEIKDTNRLSVEERSALFQESFSYRINNFKRRMEQEPGNALYRQEYEWIKEALDELEMQFVDEAFYYHEIAYIAVGVK
jgi:SAM-dependent methyltransferase